MKMEMITANNQRKALRSMSATMNARLRKAADGTDLITVRYSQSRRAGLKQVSIRRTTKKCALFGITVSLGLPRTKPVDTRTGKPESVGINKCIELDDLAKIFGVLPEGPPTQDIFHGFMPPPFVWAVRHGIIIGWSAAHVSATGNHATFVFPLVFVALPAPSQLSPLPHRPARVRVWHMDAAGRSELACLSPDRVGDLARSSWLRHASSRARAGRPWRRGERPLSTAPRCRLNAVRRAGAGDYVICACAERLDSTAAYHCPGRTFWHRQRV